MDGPRIASSRPARCAPGDEPITLSGMDRSGAAVANDGIPGERVRVRRLRPVGRSVLCEIVRVEEASPNRVRPRCRHAGACGGCAWQHVAYPEQLRRKAAALGTLLRRTMEGDMPRVLPTIGMPVGEDGMPWQFRQKAAFVFDAAPAGGLAMGHFARGTNEVVAVAECPVHSERANRIAFALRDALVSAGVSASGQRTSGLVRHVVVRTTKDDAEAVAMLVAARDDEALRAPLAALASGPEKPEGLVLNLHDRPGPYLVGRESKRVAGTGHVKEQALGPAFLVSPSSFFQTNVAAAATLVRLVVEALPGESGLRVLDLYSGSGLFALPLAARGHRVTAVEGSRKGVKDAELNRRLNKIPDARLELVCAPVEKALPRLEPGSFDAVILDPPREGSPPEVIRGVFGRLKPARGILVSCDPEALSRELPLAVAAGYRVLRVQPVDMFPHTPHIEAVAVLERRPAGKGAPPVTPRTPSSRSRTRGSRRPPARGRSRTA
jgi:23S rRNA (uracil1939-C5)-methyltransferase